MQLTEADAAGNGTATEGAPTKRRVRCLNPFWWMDIGDHGAVTPCCNSWFHGEITHVRDGVSVMDAWNGKEFQEVREAMYEGGNWEKFCNSKTCPQILNDKWIDIDNDVMPIPLEAQADIRAGRTEMSRGPAQIGLTNDPRCQLRCIMCTSAINPNRDGRSMKEVLADIETALPHVHRMRMLASGEVFVVPELRDFLFNFDTQKYPDMKFTILSNGMMLNAGLWDKIKHLNIDYLIISIDAATKETYEKIRLRGKWDVLFENLKFLAQKEKEGAIGNVQINMCVMKSNCHELVKFAQMGLDLGVSLTYFTTILGEFPNEQIFDPPQTESLLSVKQQLLDPIMQNPKVDASTLNQWLNWNPPTLLERMLA
ncbi:hypothetical protein BH09SUM1_BH09SUM1_13830 [soil metagenome]